MYAVMWNVNDKRRKQLANDQRRKEIGIVHRVHSLSNVWKEHQAMMDEKGATALQREMDMELHVVEEECKKVHCLIEAIRIVWPLEVNEFIVMREIVRHMMAVFRLMEDSMQDNGETIPEDVIAMGTPYILLDKSFSANGESEEQITMVAAWLWEHHTEFWTPETDIDIWAHLEHMYIQFRKDMEIWRYYSIDTQKFPLRRTRSMFTDKATWQKANPIKFGKSSRGLF